MSFSHLDILRPYDIRGIYGKTLTDTDAYTLGICFGNRLKEEHVHTCFILRDGRLSSPVLATRLQEGLQESGVNVILLGVGPTPLLYFATYKNPDSAGIMVTGSHNPPQYNGFKCVLKTAPFCGKDLTDLPLYYHASTKKKGTCVQQELHRPYIQNLLTKETIHRPLRIVWDCGHGASATLIHALTEGLPGTHYFLHDTLDGLFPAHPPDPSQHKNLQQLCNTVIEKNADIGIAFDGDADRIGVVDNTGTPLMMDSLMLLYIRDMLAQSTTEITCLLDIKTSQKVATYITDKGGKALFTPAGHAHIKKAIRKYKAQFAGEISGHLFFNDAYYGFDDSFYAALRLLRIVSTHDSSLKEQLTSLPTLLISEEKRLPKESDFSPLKQHLLHICKKEAYTYITIDGIRITTPDGWVLIRPSNTEPLYSLRYEPNTPDKKASLIKRIHHMFADYLHLEL